MLGRGGVQRVQKEGDRGEDGGGVSCGLVRILFHSNTPDVTQAREVTEIEIQRGPRARQTERDGRFVRKAPAFPGWTLP